MTGRALDQLLDALPRWVIVGGKGGVGKTTCAVALAARSAARHHQTLLLSTDPSRSLGDAVGESVGAAAAALRRYPGVFARQLDAGVEREAFLARWREEIVTVVDRGTYLDREDIAGLVDAALPGTDEVMAVLSLADIAAEGQWRRVIVDTAPTGHTLRLLALPETFRLVVDLLERMQEKHRFLVRALTHRYRTDGVDAMLVEWRARIAALRALFADPAATRLVLVTRAEPVVIAETGRYAAALPALGIAAGAVIINAAPETADLVAFSDILPDVPHYVVPLIADPTPEIWAARFAAAPPAPPLGGVPREITGVSGEKVARVAPAEPGATGPQVKALTIVGGKGGVGKTTVACALAIEAAHEGHPVLVVSTDPAPSVGDALGLAVGDTEVAIADAPGLWARQADATAAFAAIERSYRDRVDAVFDRLVGSGLDLAHDRRILRDLLSLAPPGIDELYALAVVGEMLDQGRYANIIVDPAPTGHLLRLLETPAVALDWSHRIMRLMLKYKEVGAMTDAAGDIVTFARRTRAVRDLLADPARAGLILVALDEPIVRREAGRLAAAVGALGLAVQAVVWNRADGTVPPLSVAPSIPQFAAPPEVTGPRGVSAIRSWRAGWTAIR